MTPEITLVLGIDAKTIEQLKISWPTWKLNRPMMWQWPWIIFYDHSQLGIGQVHDLADAMGREADGNTLLVEWPPANGPHYGSQREKMLTGHVWVPAKYVQTEWYCKLDTDALAQASDLEWPNPLWFDDSLPEIIAPRWGYTKGQGWLGTLDDWGNEVLANTEPLGCRQWPGYSDGAKRVGHPDGYGRWCSWCSLYRTDFVRAVARLCRASALEYMLPVPSQDTVMWYVGARLRSRVIKASMKSYGWNNYPRIDQLRQAAAQIMEASCAGRNAMA